MGGWSTASTHAYIRSSHHSYLWRIMFQLTTPVDVKLGVHDTVCPLLFFLPPKAERGARSDNCLSLICVATVNFRIQWDEISWACGPHELQESRATERRWQMSESSGQNLLIQSLVVRLDAHFFDLSVARFWLWRGSYQFSVAPGFFIRIADFGEASTVKICNTKIWFVLGRGSPLVKRRHHQYSSWEIP